jgi:hypothetical protein
MMELGVCIVNEVNLVQLDGKYLHLMSGKK